MARYHLTDDGPKVCSARKQCPLKAADPGVSHYENKAAADAAYQEREKNLHAGQDDMMKKTTSDPYAADRVRLQGMDPVGVDTEAAEEYGKMYELRGKKWAAEDRIKRYEKELAKTDPSRYKYIEYKGFIEDQKKAVAEVSPLLEAQQKKCQIYDDEFNRRGGWSRAFLVSNVNGHVHSSMNCHTCYDTTKYKWMTQYSGKNEKEIVDDAGERACTECFPSAVSSGSINRATKMFTDDEITAAKKREERAAAKLEKEKKAKERGIFGVDGEPLYIKAPNNKYGTTYNAEVTARTALVDNLWQLDRFKDMDSEGMEYNPLAREDTEYEIRELADAIARKHGVTSEAVLEEADKKMRKKYKI